MNVIDAGTHVGEVYAQALFELARQTPGGLAEQSKMIDAIKDDLDVVRGVSIQERDFGALMVSPYFSSEHKEQIVQKIFSGKLNDLTVNFLMAAIRHNRMMFLPQIIDKFNELREAHEGYCIVQATVSEALSKEEAKRLSENIGGAVKNKIKLRVDVNPSIMGGIIIRCGDRVIDNSIRGRLRRAVKTIMSRPKMQEKNDEV